MSWINENKIPAAILGVTGLGALGLGVLLFNAWSAAGSAQEEFDTVNTSIANLRGTELSPTPENLAAKQALVQDYQKIVGNLSLVLYKLQPEDKPISNTDFQAKLKSRIAEIKKLGGSKLPAEFNLSFDQYTSELPKSDQVASELSTYLDAIDEVVKLLLASGINSMDMLERSELPSEKGLPDKDASISKSKSKHSSSKQTSVAAVNITDRRQLKVVVRADQSALQTLLSKLASPSDMPFFTVVRLLRIENESQEGPPRAAMSTPVSAPATTEGNAGAAPTEAVAAKAVQPAPVDSRVVLGKETLRAYLEIDLVKFLNPQTAALGSK
jgi:hypothetical protein